MLRDKGLEEELVPKEEVFEFICCVCATVGVSVTLLSVLTIIIATVNRMAVANANRFFIARYVGDYSSNLFVCMKVKVMCC